MKTVMELAAETQAEIDEMKAILGDPCHQHDYDTCRKCWDIETEMDRLTVLTTNTRP